MEPNDARIDCNAIAMIFFLNCSLRKRETRLYRIAFRRNYRLCEDFSYVLA